jgi:hypothetical protein
MNPFNQQQLNQQLLAAKKKQRMLYMAVIAFFLIGVFIILTVILVSRGTRIEIQPDNAAASSVQTLPMIKSTG